MLSSARPAVLPRGTVFRTNTHKTHNNNRVRAGIGGVEPGRTIVAIATPATAGGAEGGEVFPFVFLNLSRTFLVRTRCKKFFNTSIIIPYHIVPH